MAAYTRNAIKAAYIALLDEQPSGRITVKDIVLKCGINRNTFYYYFQDLAALAEAVAAEDFLLIVQDKLTLHTLDECLEELFRFATDHRSAVLNVYRSINRELFELSQGRSCDHVVSQYLDTILENRRISDQDKQYLQDYLSSTFFGWIMDYLRKGLKPETDGRFQRILELKRGQMEEILDRCEESASGIKPKK